MPGRAARRKADRDDGPTRIGLRSCPRGSGPAPLEGALRLLLVDDHPLFREALASAIALAFPKAALHEADGIRAACEILGQNPAIDLTLLDLSMQGVTGFEGLTTIRARFPRVPILIVSGVTEPRVMQEALRHGAAGFVPKAVDKATLTRAISEVLGGALFMPPDLAAAPPAARGATRRQSPSGSPA
ncbi:response regulator [Methylorubrum aminovorans]|uniref:response regulator n=1 Tax=Methylorubrum aminovorans TaxID=269069 RepID=UPI003D676A69